MENAVSDGYCPPSVTYKTYEPRSEKTSLRGFRPGPTQTGLYGHS